MPSTNEIILEYVCPALGSVLAILMFLAPVRDLKAAIAKGELGPLNPSPWAFMLGNCVGWVLYGALLKNMWVFCCNAIGVVIALWLNLGAVKLLYQGHHAKEMRQAMVSLLEQQDKERGLGLVDNNNNSTSTSTDIPTKAADDWATTIYGLTSQMTPAPVRHDTMVLFLCGLWLILGTVLIFVDAMDVNTKALMVGAVTNCILITFYGAPLSTISKVLQEKNSATIHIPTMINNTLTGVFWCVYGIAIGDFFIYVPNGMSVGFGIVQLFLCMTFPRTTKSEHQQDEDFGDSTEKTVVPMPISSTELNSYIQDVETGTVVASI